MIKVENLYKSFQGKTVLHDISFDVQKGEVLGFLGPNGAGKSTTMRIITGFLEPDAGQVSICGQDVAQSPVEAKRYIGYLAESAATYQDMRVQSFLNFAAQIRGLIGVAKSTADYAEKRRGDRAKELKPAIKAASGTHGPKGKLPEEVELDEGRGFPVPTGDTPASAAAGAEIAAHLDSKKPEP